MGASMSTRWWTPTAVAIALAVAAVLLVVFTIAAAGEPSSPAADESGGDPDGRTTDESASGESGPEIADPDEPAGDEPASDDPVPDEPAADEPAGDVPVPDEPGDIAADPADEPDGSARGTLVVHHVGDVNLDPTQMSAPSVADPASVWNGVRDTFAE